MNNTIHNNISIPESVKVDINANANITANGGHLVIITMLFCATYITRFYIEKCIDFS